MPVVFIVPIDERKKNIGEKKKHNKTTNQPTHTRGAVKIHWEIMHRKDVSGRATTMVYIAFVCECARNV